MKLVEGSSNWSGDEAVNKNGLFFFLGGGCSFLVTTMILTILKVQIFISQDSVEGRSN